MNLYSKSIKLYGLSALHILIIIQNDSIYLLYIYSFVSINVFLLYIHKYIYIILLENIILKL